MNRKQFIRFLLRMDRKKLIIYVGALVLLIFSFTQCIDCIHFPVRNQDDVEYMSDKSCDALYVKCSNKEIYQNIQDYLEHYAEYISKDEKEYFVRLVAKMSKEKKNFSEMYDIVEQEHPDYLQQVNAFEQCCTNKLGTLKQIRSNTEKIVKEKGYLTEQYRMLQSILIAILSILALPMVLQALTEDKLSDFTDIVDSCAIDKNQYQLLKVAIYYVPLLVVSYLIGIVYDIYNFLKFKRLGFMVTYHPFAGDFIIYTLITILFILLLLTFAVQRVKHMIVVVPFYLLYCIFNISQTGDGVVKEILRCIIRQDFYSLNLITLVVNRLLYLGLSVFLLQRILTYKKEGKRKNEVVEV